MLSWSSIGVAWASGACAAALIRISETSDKLRRCTRCTLFEANAVLTIRLVDIAAQLRKVAPPESPDIFAQCRWQCSFLCAMLSCAAGLFDQLVFKMEIRGD